MVVAFNRRDRSSRNGATVDTTLILRTIISISHRRCEMDIEAEGTSVPRSRLKSANVAFLSWSELRRRFLDMVGYK